MRNSSLFRQNLCGILSNKFTVNRAAPKSQLMLFLIWVVALVAAFVLFYRETYSKFSRHGVKNLMALPLLGNMTRLTLGLEHLFENNEKIYKSFPDEKFVGVFEYMRPVVMIRDLELAKRVSIKDFDHFVDHSLIIDNTVDPLFGHNLLILKGQKWKDMRSTISPAFTSSKMRRMVPFMTEAGDLMINRIKRDIQKSGTNYIDVEFRDLCTRYANDVVASCAFGLNVDSQNEVDNKFFLMTKASSQRNMKQVLKFIGFQSFPYIMKFLKVTFFPRSAGIFFSKIAKQNMKQREMHGIYRPDMIHLLMEAKKGKLVHEEDKTSGTDIGFAAAEESNIGKKINKTAWSDDALIAQAMGFIAGIEINASAMSMLTHELALNPDVQEKLVEEIKEAHKKNNGKFDIIAIQQMTYLDMVVSEMLRLWTQGGVLERICTKDYNLGKPNDNVLDDYIIRKGEGIKISVYGIHRDPKYFPDPTKFDPERFSEKNRHKIHPYTYIPFGIGPRNCVASRFALCEVKVMIYQLLQHVEISPCKKTIFPTKLESDSIHPFVKGGHWLRLKLRE